MAGGRTIFSGAAPPNPENLKPLGPRHHPFPHQPAGKISLAIHVYDGDFFSLGRSHWEAETLAEKPYDGTQISPMFTGGNTEKP